MIIIVAVKRTVFEQAAWTDGRTYRRTNAASLKGLFTSLRQNWTELASSLYFNSVAAKMGTGFNAPIFCGGKIKSAVVRPITSRLRATASTTVRQSAVFVFS